MEEGCKKARGSLGFDVRQAVRCGSDRVDEQNKSADRWEQEAGNRKQETGNRKDAVDTSDGQR